MSEKGTMGYKDARKCVRLSTLTHRQPSLNNFEVSQVNHGPVSVCPLASLKDSVFLHGIFVYTYLFFP